MLWNLNGAPDPVRTSSPFADVAVGAWFGPAAMWAFENNIMAGTVTDGVRRFNPTLPISRQEMAVTFINYTNNFLNLGLVGAGLPFPDASLIAPWAADQVAIAADNNIMAGDAAGRFNPLGNATRVEVAQVFKNFVERVVSPRV